MRKTLLLTAVVGGMLMACTNKKQTTDNNIKQELNLVQEWDKVFPLSEKVNHQKVTFETQYGLTLAADVYTPKEADGKMAALAVSGPFGAVKEESRHAAREAVAKQRLADPTAMGGGVVDPVPDDAPQFVRDYHDYYKTPRGYHARSGNSNDGWRVTGLQAYSNARFLYYTNEIRSAVLVMHGEKAHSRYFGENAYKYMVEGKAEGYRSAMPLGSSKNFTAKPNPVPQNKQLLIIPGASHCDLYDGGEKNYIPWDKLETFFR